MINDPRFVSTARQTKHNNALTNVLFLRTQYTIGVYPNHLRLKVKNGKLIRVPACLIDNLDKLQQLLDFGLGLL